MQHLTFQEGEISFYAPGVTDHVGKLKGLQQILFEKGLLVPGMAKTGGKRGDKNSSPALSMVAVLGTQSDLNVDPSLVVLVKRCGGVAIMLPKFRCEINPTGLVWGRYTIQCLTNLLRVMQRPSTA